MKPLLTIPAWVKSSVITVGDGRGFVVRDGQDNRLVITAAHCLPYFPPCHAMSYLSDVTYKNLLGPMAGKPDVWAECLFADPIADIAVLGSPDNQGLAEQAAAYEELVTPLKPLPIAAMPRTEYEASCSAWLLSLEGEWFGCRAQCIGNGPLWVTESTEPIRGGMSGSPIITDGGKAIGVVSCAAESEDGTALCASQSRPVKNPRLTRDLPGWLLRTRR
jgi:hypothetical protein